MTAPRVVFEDRWLLVVDKPSGLMTQAGATGGDHLLAHLADRPYVGLHHRLDAPVSGLVLLTVDRSANAAIGRAFQEHAIARTYLAVASGEVRATRWDRPVDGQAARTDVEPVAWARGTTSLVLRPRTGRKHQLRVHAALAGHPLLGDRQYGEAAGRAWPRIALHASTLELAHPMTGEALRFESPLPPDLQPLWARFVETSGS